MADVNKIKLVSDRVRQAQDLLLSQFKDKPNILALVDSLVTEVQKLENTIIDLQNVRTLQGSYGIWLDEIGKRHKVSRGNYDDNDYKNAIKLAASKRTSSASVDNILRIVTLLTNDTDATIVNNYPYLQELYSYMFCLDQSPEGIVELASLFPVNSRVRIIQTNELPFKTGTVGQGVGAGRLCNLLYVKEGVVNDPRFISVGQAIIPPAVQTNVINIAPPFITGDILIGNTLAVSLGLWEGDEPITYTYQWYRNGVTVGGETNATYLLTVTDEDTSISCVVTGDNGFSSATASTVPVSIGSTPVVPPSLESDIGLYDFIAAVKENVTPIAVTAVITFTKDGAVTYTADGNTYANKDWATTPSTDIGADYTISYTSDTGGLLDKSPNISYGLSSNQVFTATRIMNAAELLTHDYTFTLRKVSDSGVSAPKLITITLENEFYGIPE